MTTVEAAGQFKPLSMGEQLKLVIEVATLKSHIQWLESNLCAAHLDIQSCSSGPCPMCERDELRLALRNLVVATESADNVRDMVAGSDESVVEEARKLLAKSEAGQ